ncbi:unnamed protein product [Clonostachys rosea f. rosea IK726]|uniref:Uncharacterized protein n=1 Tax=Clonostachys rosea f. rosea IK726 TaxID=1349383 RepID=A0ACA9USF6_BIOOC|nr:unnamed protein product [Clonostachys rosea f. rosea IK726]
MTESPWLTLMYEIYGRVICSATKPPPSPARDRRNRRSLPDGSRDTQGIFYRTPDNPALSLLRVNRQVNEEVSNFLSYLPTRNYHVDIMCVKESGLWPTWSIPPPLPGKGSFSAPTQYIDSIYATLRIFNPPKAMRSYFRNGLTFHLSYGQQDPIIDGFYGLLEAFFHRGPGFTDRSRPEDDPGVAPRYIVKDIIIDITAPPDASKHRSVIVDDLHYRPDRLTSRYAGHDDVSVAPEERLAALMSRHLEMLLSFTPKLLNKGMLVYEQMSGSFVFVVCGKEYRRVEVEERLHKLEEVYLGTDGEPDLDLRGRFERWRRWVDERRRSMKEGLDLSTHRPVQQLKG